MRRNSFSMPASSRGGKVFRNSSSARYNRKPQGRGAYINPEKFINKASLPEEVVPFVPKHRFTDFRLSDALQRNVAAHGYITPTPIQDVGIPPILEGRDFIGLANTGTGKTAAFILPIIERLQNHQGTAALIIAPTRELAVQINEEFRAFARGLGLYSALCVGGTNMRQQIMALQRRPQVVVGTPGRLKDLNQQKALRLQHTDILVLDEADRMLDMGFITDIRFLVAQLPTKRQTLCFSATITPEIERLIHALLTNPITESVRTSETSDHVEQDIIEAHTKEEKLEILSDLLKQPDFEKVLIFGQTKWGVQRLADNLTKLGLPAQAIHGNKSQSQRQRSLQAFKTNVARILVATDVAARGLDIPNVSHVINFDQPGTYEDYIHRIGRTGRAGQRGKALTFINRR
ncbi:MAG TPA: DEAD/DEAH box helicase [Candidatus Saccharimonadales bacterium]|nr:DEAD/DEAH box helicase [Candidatus Saccharimonadales bacterium]